MYYSVFFYCRPRGQAAARLRRSCHLEWFSLIREDGWLDQLTGEMYPHFIGSTRTGRSAHGHIGWKAWAKRYEAYSRHL
jgi:hypothetical protein